MTGHETQIETDLRTVDETLARGAVTAAGPLERELEELVLELAADPPAPDPAFAAGLGERVRAGFPRRRARRLPRPAWRSLRRPPMVALAGAASILVAVAVAISLQTGDGGYGDPPASNLDSSVESAGGGAAERALPEPSVAPSPPVSPGQGFAPGREDRRIERSASLTLAAPADRLEEVSNRVIAITDRYQGFVLSSSVATGEEGGSSGDFELRIPAAKLQPALRDLSALGDVRSRTQAGQDITREFVSAGDRLRAARAERRGLLARLESAETDSAAESIRRRLDLVAAEINGLRGRLRDLRLRGNYATVAVALESSGEDGSGAADSSRDGLGGAFHDAADSLSGSVELAVRIAGIAVAPGILLALAWLGTRAARRRRREAVLG